MRFFKTRFERIYLAISIGYIFFIDSVLLLDYSPNCDNCNSIRYLIINTILPFVLYTMYKLIFKKEENKPNTN
jgi:hypothetical protein